MKRKAHDEGHQLGRIGWLRAAVLGANDGVMVSSQADTEQAALRQERAELKSDPEAELNELTAIYVSRGLEADLARQVAVQLTHKDALGAHARDELGITEIVVARPTQAAVASALSFSIGALIPILAALFFPQSMVLAAIPAASLVGLAILGALGARAGGARLTLAALRVVLGGAVAMAVTGAVGALIGRAV
jgi:VIT1/CCC1 family predicted Fe2+/Mn2+ transporter